MMRHGSANRIALLGPLGTVSYAELTNLIDCYAGSFAEWGVAPGGLVGILAARRVETVAAFFGAMQAGACPCIMEPNLSGAMVAERVRAVGMSHLVLDQRLEELSPLLSRLGTQLRALGSLANGSPFFYQTIQSSDSAMMIFTSGSTSRPKGVLLSQSNLLCNAQGILQHTPITPDDRLLHVMPLHHTNGINNQLIAPFVAGASVALIDTFRAEQAVAQLGEYSPTYMTGVPTMYSRMLRHVARGKRFASLCFLRCGSAPIAPDLHEQIETTFGVPLSISYGLSEATCTSAMNPPRARKVGTVGTVLAGQMIKLFTPGAWNEVRQGSQGEVCIAGPALMKGYLNSGDERPITKGWLRTGDLGMFDEDGYLSITGRIKDTIIRGGENLSPAVIEGVLGTNPSVQACCVIGAPDQELGEVAVAFVVFREGCRVSKQDLRDYVADRLSRVYAPAEFVFVDELPENAVGKIDRIRLKSLLANARPQ
jgi:acyl-CoA synthetase (AMP-forming)/AMP-acid ligase II